MYSIFKDTFCTSGNGLINNNDFRKCDPKMIEQTSEMPSIRKSTYSLKYFKIDMDAFTKYIIEPQQTTLDQLTYVTSCMEDALFGDLYYGSESTIQVVQADTEEYQQEHAVVLTRSVHPMHYDTFTKIFCGPNNIPESLISTDFSGRPYGFSFDFSRKLKKISL